jgi:hypothetical protein
VDHFILTARLLEGAHERALELAANATPPGGSGIDRFGIYLSRSEVIFLVEAPDAERLVRRMLNDPVRSTELSHWLPLFDGPLHRAAEVYHWTRLTSVHT